MRNLRYALVLLPMMFAPQGAHAIACSDVSATNPLPVRSTPVPPLAVGLAGRPAPFASPHLLLAESRDESLALDLVLLRLRLETCVKDQYAGYKPRTQFDNTPWRFNMEKGKKFNAAEFDAWMKSRGVRVATGNAPAGPASATAAAAAALPAAVPVDAANAVKE